MLNFFRASRNGYKNSNVYDDKPRVRFPLFVWRDEARVSLAPCFITAFPRLFICKHAPTLRHLPRISSLWWPSFMQAYSESVSGLKRLRNEPQANTIACKHTYQAVKNIIMPAIINMVKKIIKNLSVPERPYLNFSSRSFLSSISSGER